MSGAVSSCGRDCFGTVRIRPAPQRLGHRWPGLAGSRQPDDETGAGLGILDPDFTAMRRDDLPDDGKAEPRSCTVVDPCRIEADEALENALPLEPRHARPVIGDRQVIRVRLRRDPELDAVASVPLGIVGQVGNDTGELSLVATHPSRAHPFH